MTPQNTRYPGYERDRLEEARREAHEEKLREDEEADHAHISDEEAWEMQCEHDADQGPDDEDEREPTWGEFIDEISGGEGAAGMTDNEREAFGLD